MHKKKGWNKLQHLLFYIKIKQSWFHSTDTMSAYNIQLSIYYVLAAVGGGATFMCLFTQLYTFPTANVY